MSKRPNGAEQVTLAQLFKGRFDSQSATNNPNVNTTNTPTLDALTECLSFSPVDGRIWLNDQRMILLHSSSFGMLRQQMIDTFGLEQTKRLLMRTGYASGTRDAEIVRKTFPDADPTSIFNAGTQLHGLEGVVQVETIFFEFDQSKGSYQGEFYWHNSSEAEQHIKSYGVGSEPVCWMELGYAIGYVSGLLGTLVIFHETECLGTGHTKCKIVGKTANLWPKDLRSLAFLSNETEVKNTKVAESNIIQPTDAAEHHSEIIGVSASFTAATKALDKVAGTQATVLIMGESGVGKELFARMLHKRSKRHQHPFIAFNCAAIPENLLESELFGVDKGAYTGASNSRPGRFERANGGTLFLDELGTLSLSGQSKLLRVLQEKEIERVGGTSAIKVDVRVVAATNIDLRQAVARGEFREDLFFRLNVFPILLPPLRERRDDVPLLLNYYFHHFCQLHDKYLSGITARASRALLNYEFPGNIRELQNIIERGVISAEHNEAIDLHHMFHNEAIPEPLLYSISENGELKASGSTEQHADMSLIEKLTALNNQPFSINELEERLLKEAVEHNNGNLSAAARMLGLTRAQLAYRLKKG